MTTRKSRSDSNERQAVRIRRQLYAVFKSDDPLRRRAVVDKLIALARHDAVDSALSRVALYDHWIAEQAGWEGDDGDD
jgi:hypothetical protein